VKRLLPLALALALVLAACGSSDEAVVTVNGDEVLQADDFQDQLDQLEADEDFLTTFDGRGAGEETLKAGFVASILSNHVLDALLIEELADRGLEPNDDDRQSAADDLESAVGGPLDTIPPSYRDTLLDLFTHAATLRRDLGDDDQALQDRVTELFDAADIDIDDRYGQWDAEGHSVVPPDGPVAATTEALTPAGG
jgi:hypothetical protein